MVSGYGGGGFPPLGQVDTLAIGDTTMAQAARPCQAGSSAQRRRFP